jgi:hypothetical protein
VDYGAPPSKRALRRRAASGCISRCGNRLNATGCGSTEKSTQSAKAAPYPARIEGVGASCAGGTTRLFADGPVGMGRPAVGTAACSRFRRSRDATQACEPTRCRSSPTRATHRRYAPSHQRWARHMAARYACSFAPPRIGGGVTPLIERMVARRWGLPEPHRQARSEEGACRSTPRAGRSGRDSTPCSEPRAPARGNQRRATTPRRRSRGCGRTTGNHPPLLGCGSSGGDGVDALWAGQAFEIVFAVVGEHETGAGGEVFDRLADKDL